MNAFWARLQSAITRLNLLWQRQDALEQKVTLALQQLRATRSN